MKRIVAILALVALAGAGHWAMAGRRCTGSDPCTACRNCHACKYCAKDGGSCGVCKKKAAPERDTFCGEKRL